MGHTGKSGAGFERGWDLVGLMGWSGHGLELGSTGVMLGSNRVLVEVGAGRFDGVGAGLE